MESSKLQQAHINVRQPFSSHASVWMHPFWIAPCVLGCGRHNRSLLLGMGLLGFCAAVFITQMLPVGGGVVVAQCDWTVVFFFKLCTTGTVFEVRFGILEDSSPHCADKPLIIVLLFNFLTTFHLYSL